VVPRVFHRCEPERNRVLICESHVRFRRIARVSCASQLTPPVMMRFAMARLGIFGLGGLAFCLMNRFLTGSTAGIKLPPDRRPRSRLVETLFLSAEERNLGKGIHMSRGRLCAGVAYILCSPRLLLAVYTFQARQTTAATTAEISEHVNGTVKERDRSASAFGVSAQNTPRRGKVLRPAPAERKMTRPSSCLARQKRYRLGKQKSMRPPGKTVLARFCNSLHPKNNTDRTDSHLQCTLLGIMIPETRSFHILQPALRKIPIAESLSRRSGSSPRFPI